MENQIFKQNSPEGNENNQIQQVYNSMLSGLEGKEIPQAIDRQQSRFLAIQYSLDQIFDCLNLMGQESSNFEQWKIEMMQLKESVQEKIKNNWVKFNPVSVKETEGKEEIQTAIKNEIQQFFEKWEFDPGAMKENISSILNFQKVIAEIPNPDMKIQNKMRHSYGHGISILKESL